MLRLWIDKQLDAFFGRRHPLKSRVEIRAEVEERHDQIGHSIAQRFSRGNVNIKRGAFLTREDIDAHKRQRSA